MRAHNVYMNRMVLMVMVLYISGSYLVYGLLSGFEITVVQEVLISQILLLGIPVITTYRNNVQVSSVYRINPIEPASLVWVFMAAFCFYPLGTILNMLNRLLMDSQTSADTLSLMGEYSLPVSVVLLVIVPSVCEEVVFRGFIYSGYRPNGFWRASVLSSILFALFHLNSTKLLDTFVVGMFLCLLVEATGSILSSMTGHAVINGISVFLEYTISGSADESSSTAVNIEDIISEYNNAGVPGGIYAGAIASVVIFTLLCVVFVYLTIKTSGRNEIFIDVLKEKDVKRPAERIFSGALILVYLISVIYMVLYNVTG